MGIVRLMLEQVQLLCVMSMQLVGVPVTTLRGLMSAVRGLKISLAGRCFDFSGGLSTIDVLVQRCQAWVRDA